MDKDEAFEQFSNWYEKCLKNGIEPEEIVQMMGEMALITDGDIVDKHQENSDISSY